MTDQEIFTGIRQKDNRSFTFLHNACLGPITRMVEKNSGHEQDAMDVLQEGLVAVWMNISQGKYELRSQVKMTTYVQQICRNIWISKLRKRKNTFSLSDQAAQLISEEPEILDEAYDQVKLLQGLLNQLNDSCKKLLHLFYYQKFALKEIATQLNLTEPTAKNNKYRCMQKLRAIYENNNLAS